MLIPFFRLLLTIHILADFYFQSQKTAQEKQSKILPLVLHGLLYLQIALMFICLFWSTDLMLYALGLAGLHFLIDLLKFFYCQRKQWTPKVYIIDQLCHLFSIAALSIVAIYQNLSFSLIPELNEFFVKTAVNFEEFFSILTLVLLLGKPASLTIRILLRNFRPDNEDNNKKSAGAIIGILERIIILVFLSIQQYSAIGLVLTAKSVARYNKISEDQQFAEYYLLGTLMSTLFVLCCYLLLA